MKNSRCIAHCGCSHGRREFIRKSALFTAGALLADLIAAGSTYSSFQAVAAMRPAGPASTYIPFIKAAFVRRKEDYGMRWPGAVYDGAAAKEKYSALLKEYAAGAGIKLEIREEPVYSADEGIRWIAGVKESGADGLVLIMLDRQDHAWPTAEKAASSGVPAVIFSPLGTSFTTNTSGFAGKPGCVVYSTNDFGQAIYGLKMLKAGARMKRSRCVVIKGTERKETLLSPDTGITLQYVPADTFIKIYRSVPESNEVLKMADDYIMKAKTMRLATRKDVINGIRSYLVAGRILADEKADAISMDCLGALGNIDISLPCISWSRMNDDGIPAACEADTGAIASHIIVQYLFERPGFQQDPVADTSDDTLIGAHCSCPTRLGGFQNPPEPFELVHHHGNRDAVPRTIWRKGQRITLLDFEPGKERSQMLFAAGTVVDNLSVPPSGGCVVSVKYKMDGTQDVLSFPGMHQLFFYGDYRKQLKDFCQLYNFEAKMV